MIVSTRLLSAYNKVSQFFFKCICFDTENHVEIDSQTIQLLVKI